MEKCGLGLYHLLRLHHGDQPILILVLSGLFTLNLIPGLGIFGLLATLVSSFSLIRSIEEDYDRGGSSIVRDFALTYARSFRAYFVDNLVLILIIGLILFNISHLRRPGSLVSGIMYYISIGALGFVVFMAVFYSYIRAYYSDVSKRDGISNAFCMAGAYFVEMAIFFAVLLVGLGLIDRMIGGLVIFLGPDLVILLLKAVSSRLLDGYSIRNFFVNSFN